MSGRGQPRRRARRGAAQETAASAAEPNPPPPSSPAAASSSTPLHRQLEAKLSLNEQEATTSAAPLPSSSQATTSAAPPPSSSVPPPPSSSKAVDFPRRPGYGQIGVKCRVRANHFPVTVSKDALLCHYDVAISPEVTSIRVNRAILSQLVDLHKLSHLGKKTPAYDGRKNLYTSGRLPFESKDFVIKLVDKDENSPARRERNFKVSIKFAGHTDVQQLLQFLAGRQRDVPQEAVHVLDVVLRGSSTKNYVPVGRSFFSPKLDSTDSLGDGLECWRGFYQSVRLTQMGLSLNIDVACTSFYESIPVVEFVCKFLGVPNTPRPLSETDRVKIKKALRGVRVFVTHLDFPRQYRISGVSPRPTSDLRFSVDDSNDTTVARYFKDKYKIVLRYASWPSLIAGNENKPTYLPMEVCTIVHGQRYSKKLNDRQVTAILRAACQRPSQREQKVLDMVRRNNYKKDDFAIEFGIQVEERLSMIDARVLPPPKLKYHASGREAICQPRVGQWNMINKKMIDGGKVHCWTCINFSRMNVQAVNIFCKQLVKMCQDIGMDFCDAPAIQITHASPERIDVPLKDVHNRATSNKKKLQLLIIILPDVRGNYGTIKRICETELGIVSQCCQPRKASRADDRQYLENVSLKINVKVGGRNTVLVDALSGRIPLLTDTPTIIFGADVTHPPPGEDSSPSIAAVVASMDWPEVTKYRCLLSSQHHRQELIEDLAKVVHDPQRGPQVKGMIRDHLIAFLRATGKKPQRIIFYRDGVSEGQFKDVLLYELNAIWKACASLEEKYLPPVTFIVVQKRHHTRLFPADHKNRDLTDRSGNILPGTVVDRQICHPHDFDFYLCSHAGIQGTSRPTHYHVLWDENKFSADQLQTLTNNLCYTYARCTRAVSVVPPAYYAHLAAFRARYYIESELSEGSSAVVSQFPLVMDNVKEVMFYC